ncbi:MAG TPA: glutamyl-tRNA reductase, partial [Roseiflexaceae bacterium]|nr:glutamyl-tRNA reductase [Roseiflexaceae bacterium]
MQLVITGLHQRTAPLALRERLACAAADLPDALQRLRAFADEGFIISTCNRVEVCGIVDAPHDEYALRQFLLEWKRLTPDELLPHVYTLTGDDAAHHIFRLAAGLDSMVLGEDQIMAQIKAAMNAANDAGMLGNVLHRLLQSALAAGKLVRTQTGIARTPVSVVSVALDLARQTLGSFHGKHVTVVGAGRMAELALKHLHSDRMIAIRVLSRTYERAAALAEQYGVAAAPFAELEQAVRASDVVISCTSAPEIVLDSATIERATAGRSAPLLLLDLAVPRDIDQQAATLPHVRLFDIDDMQAVSEANRAARMAEIVRAEELLEGEAAKFSQWWSAQRVVPTIRALRERAEAIRAAELERTLARLPELSPREQ